MLEAARWYHTDTAPKPDITPTLALSCPSLYVGAIFHINISFARWQKWKKAFS
jgi:hypothetical protein